MAQHDMNIANQGFPAFRSDLNDALAALVSNSSGATEPSTTFAHQMWVDTSANPSVLKIRNADNDAWITIGTIDQTGDKFVFSPAGGSASQVAYGVAGEIDTGMFFPASDTIAFAEGGAEAMRIDSSSRLLVGTTTARVNFFNTSASAGIQIEGTGTNRRVAVISDESGSPANLILALQNSGAVGGNTLVSNNDFVGTVSFQGNDGTEFVDLARIDAYVDGTPGANDMPGRLVFSTTADGGSSPTERARITSGGYFKASDNGTYNSPTGGYHEFINTTTNPVLNVLNKDASFADAVINGGADRSANSAYSFTKWYSTYSGGGFDVEFNLRGDGNAFADGTWSNNGADYAEFFESANGEALTLGATVVLDGNKIREATEQDPASAIIGVVRPKEPSKASMIIGNTAWNKWANKYLSDDFDRYIMEDHDVVEWEETITDENGNISTEKHSYESHNIPEGITVPQDATRKTHDDNGVKFQHYKLNPAWNPDSEYVNRENRPEWNIIGLLGQVKILKGQPVGDRWVKMRDVSDTVEEWFIR